MEVNTATDKEATDRRLAIKVAATTSDQRCARMQEILDSPDRSSDEMTLEFAKLVMGPDATVSDSPTILNLTGSKSQ